MNNNRTEQPNSLRRMKTKTEKKRVPHALIGIERNRSEQFVRVCRVKCCNVNYLRFSFNCCRLDRRNMCAPSVCLCTHNEEILYVENINAAFRVFFFLLFVSSAVVAVVAFGGGRNIHRSILFRETSTSSSSLVIFSLVENFRSFLMSLLLL